jgi:hypothetical protein
VANGAAHRDVVIDHEDSRRRGSGMVGDPTGLSHQDETFLSGNTGVAVFNIPGLSLAYL